MRLSSSVRCMRSLILLKVVDSDAWLTANALVQLQARYNHCGEAASEKCLSTEPRLDRCHSGCLHYFE
jgi:hypothetical protein